jgi:ligand-binding sensor domain-containing protein
LRYDGEHLHHYLFPEQDLEAAFGIAIDPNGPSRPYSVYGIDRDTEGNLLFGTESAGVFRYDGDTLLWIGEKELSVLEDGRVPAVRSIVQDKEGNYWLSNIIHRYAMHDPLSPASRVKGKGYTLLEGTDHEDVLGEGVLPYFVSAVTDEAEGDLCMATYNEGLWRYDGQHLTVYDIMDGERPLNLLCLYKDRAGTIWLGTEDAGVYRMEEDAFRLYRPNLFR